MFNHCCALEDMSIISEFDLSNVKYMNSMFAECFSLEKIPKLSNVPKAINVSFMFFLPEIKSS